MKRIVRRVALGMAAIVIASLMVFIIVNHGYNFSVYLSSQGPPGEGIAIPEAPLLGDDAFLTVSKIAGQIDKTLTGRDCLGTKPPYRLDWDCMAFLKTQAVALKTLDEWLTGTSPYKLERPAHLGRHSRFPLPDTLSDSNKFLESHDFIRFKALATLLALRSLMRVSAGNVTLAEKDLRTIFSMGAFLQQNPPFISQAIGTQVHSTGLAVIVHHVTPAAIREGFETMLPAPQSILDGMRMGAGAEWIIGQDSIKRLGPAPSFYGQTEPFKIMRVIGQSVPWFMYMPPALIRALGLYNQDHSLRLAAMGYRTAQNDLVSGNIGSSFRGPEPGACDWATMGSIKWIHNPVGRWWTCQFQVIFPNRRVGQTIDQVEATRVVIVARRFWLRYRSWPTQESDLVPTYLKEWPKSALDGQPLPWMDNKRGVHVLARDGSRCKEDEFCYFPFEPPQPVGKQKNSTGPLSSPPPPSAVKREGNKIGAPSPSPLPRWGRGSRLVPLTREHRQPRVLREARIGLGFGAAPELRGLRRHDAAAVDTVGAEADLFRPFAS